MYQQRTDALARNNMRAKGTTVGEVLLYVAVFFPYIALFSLGTDLQPYALGISILYLIYFIIRYDLKLSSCEQVLFWTFFVAVCVALLARLSFDSIRSLANYGSVLFVSVAAHRMIRKNGLNEFLIKCIIVAWFVVGLIQTLVYRDFLSFLTAGARTTDTRGVYGLASEPSFYSITMVFVLFLVKDFHRNRHLFFVLVTVQCVFFAQSAYGLILYALFSLMWIVGDIQSRKRSIALLLALFVGVGGVAMVFVLFFSEHRLSMLIASFLNGDFLSDDSVQLRLADIINSLDTFVKRFAMPSGFGDRIMSGYGAVMVELGILGVPLLCVVSYAVANVFANQKAYWMVFILFSIFMMGAIQLAHPCLAFLVGYGLYKKSTQRGVVAFLQGQTNIHSA